MAQVMYWSCQSCGRVGGEDGSQWKGRVFEHCHGYTKDGSGVKATQVWLIHPAWLFKWLLTNCILGSKKRSISVIACNNYIKWVSQYLRFCFPLVLRQRSKDGLCRQRSEGWTATTSSGGCSVSGCRSHRSSRSLTSLSCKKVGHKKRHQKVTHFRTWIIYETSAVFFHRRRSAKIWEIYRLPLLDVLLNLLCYACRLMLLI